MILCISQSHMFSIKDLTKPKAWKLVNIMVFKRKIKGQLYKSSFLLIVCFQGVSILRFKTEVCSGCGENKQKGQ